MNQNMKRHSKGTQIAGQKTGGQFKQHARQEAEFTPTLTATATAVVGSPLDRNFDSVEEKIAAMGEHFAAQVEALDNDENWNRYLDSMSKFHNYSMSNQMLIALQRPDATRVASKTRWAELGRKPLPYSEERGRGISIFRPKVGFVEAVDNNGNPVIGEDGKPVRERKVFGYTTATVYDISQTEGEPLPEVQRELSEEPPAGFVDDLENTIRDYGYELSYEPLPENHGGYTAPAQNGKPARVVIREGMSEGSRARVLAHELGHIAAGHVAEEELAKYHTGEGGRRGAMEIEAESVAYVLLGMNGMRSAGDVSNTYAAGWATTDRSDPDVVKKSAANVQAAVKQLVSERKWVNVEGSGPQPKKTFKRKPRAGAKKKK